MTKNPLGGANHLYREPAPPRAPRPQVEPQADLNNFEGFEKARKQLKQAEASGMVIELLEDGRLRIQYEVRHTPFMLSLRANKCYIVSVLQGILPACETAGDRTIRVEEF